MLFGLLVLLLIIALKLSRKKVNLFIIVLYSSIVFTGLTVLYYPGTSGNVDEEEVVITEESIIEEDLFIHYLDVGQADSIFIDYGDYEILIDAGNIADAQYISDYIEPYADEIELVIATHPHEDHIGGFSYIFENYDILKVIDSGYDYDTKVFDDYYGAILNENAEYVEDRNMKIVVDDNFEIQIIESGDNYKNTNDNSVIVKLIYKDTSFLFTGDMEKKAEASVMRYNLKSDVLKAAHHGSETSSTKEFLDLINPDIIVISVGQNNRYGHPSEETMSRFFKYTKDVYLTSVAGTVVLKSDGENIQKVTKP